MTGDQIFIYPGIDHLVGAEGVVRPLKAPYSYLRVQIVIDLLNYILILNDQLERNNVARGMYTFVGSSTANEGGFLGIVCVCFGNGTGRYKCLE